jgi:hypothetical protein
LRRIQIIRYIIFIVLGYKICCNVCSTVAKGVPFRCVNHYAKLMDHLTNTMYFLDMRKLLKYFYQFSVVDTVSKLNITAREQEAALPNHGINQNLIHPTIPVMKIINGHPIAINANTRAKPIFTLFTSLGLNLLNLKCQINLLGCLLMLRQIIIK